MKGDNYDLVLRYHYSVYLQYMEEHKTAIQKQ